jgi:Raf kinase inhibitor-like YbhB/YbcL family protein
MNTLTGTPSRGFTVSSSVPPLPSFSQRDNEAGSLLTFVGKVTRGEEENARHRFLGAGPRSESSVGSKFARKAHSGVIPPKFTCDGSDRSPALSGNDPPSGTKAFALIMDDSDAPAGTWVHWVLYDLPASVRECRRRKIWRSALDRGSNDFQRIGYCGPCPPRGAAHQYSFRLYALDRPTHLPAGVVKRDLERAMKGHILAQSELVGRFQH